MRHGRSRYRMRRDEREGGEERKRRERIAFDLGRLRGVRSAAPPVRDKNLGKADVLAFLVGRNWE